MAKKKNYLTTAYVAAVTRITLGFIFLWPFFDKMFGLGFSTCRAKDGVVSTFCDAAWIKGGSPTAGFLKFGTKGSPFESVFQSMAGNSFWDWLFMAALASIGIALILGIASKLATIAGASLLFLMFLAQFQPVNNPLVDDHIIYILVLLGLHLQDKEQVLGLGKWWKKQEIVKRYPILQ